MRHISFASLGALLLMSAAFVTSQNTAGAQQSTNANQQSTVPKPADPALPPVVSAPRPLEPAGSGEPHTEMLDTSNSPAALDPLLQPEPLARARLSLIGGTARKVDVGHSRVTVQPFGGGNKYLIYFDERTRILSGGRETTVLAIRPGDRLYADTQAIQGKVFARTIRVRTIGGPAHASGQVIEILGGQVRLQDRLSGETVRFAITDRTKVESHGAPLSAGDVHSGSLIDVTFTPGRRSDAQNITIYASPGQSYIFAGILTHVDLRDGVLALDNQVDGNNYELSFDPLEEKSLNRMVVGTSVSVSAIFDGKRYRATSIKVTEVAGNLDSSDQ